MTYRLGCGRLALGMAVILLTSTLAAADDPSWVAPMTAVHATFTGARGTVARFGDSITYSGAFFKPLQYDFTNATTTEQSALTWLHAYMVPSCWTWQDDAVAASNGCYSGTLSSWPLDTNQAPPARNIDTWLTKLKPEIAVIMWGTNDLPNSGVTVATYTSNMRKVVQACTAVGTIPVLTTIPPRRGQDTRAAQFAQAMRDLATELQVPLIDYYQEIMTRQPTTWDGTLISSDGVHPSYNGSTAQDFANTSLNTNGYLLRNWVTLHALWDVYQYIIQFDPPVKHHTVTVVDTASSDVPGPQPIRVFPVPAAAQWPGATLVFNNWDPQLTFSTSNHPPYDSEITLPITNSSIAIHGVNNSPASPNVINDTFSLYVTQEGSDTDIRVDNRFPYHVPRLARSHASDYLAVEFDLASPVEKFGVFLPASSNNWSSDPQYINDDQNFLLQDRSVWVTIIDDSGASQQQYVSLKGDANGTYCPFLSISWDETHKISKVSIIHDINENTDRGVSFMDVYTYVTPPALEGDINHDGYVNVGDLQLLVAAWGSTSTTVPSSANWNADADINSDDYVNVGDLQLLVQHWGEHQ